MEVRAFTPQTKYQKLVPTKMPTDRLPPNQVLTAKFPVVGEKDPGQSIDINTWKLVVDGEVERAVELSYEDILAIPQRDRKTDIHCVTGWSRYDTIFTGIPLTDLLAVAKLEIKPSAKFIRFLAYSARNHDVSLPIEVALEDSWLVHSADGEPLSISRGYPLRVLTPSKYLYKSLKWVHRIEFMEEDRLGFWERASGYHNHADPWQEERLSAHRFTSVDETEAFKRLNDFSEYRGEDGPVIVKADFRDWTPATKDLRGVKLKACNFSGADLGGCDFSGANLTLSQFSATNLERADFSGADLEGADFDGAYLAGARFDRNFMSATTFKSREGLRSFEGMTVSSPDGLLESQESYLERLGVEIVDII